MKRVVALLMAFVLVMTSQSMTVYAEEMANLIVQEDNPEEVCISFDETYINPVYASVLTEDDLVQFAEAPVALEDSYFTTYEQAGEYLREQLKNRSEVITLNYCTDAMIDNTIFSELWEIAMCHTGVPTEGDYLYFHLGGYQASARGSYNPTIEQYNFSLTYTVTWYSTAEREQETSARLQSVMDELLLDGKNDYEIVQAIYTYICENVVYDYANLNDETYTEKYTACAALLDGTAVCQGYATLLYRMLLEEGIDCRVITGVGNGGAHAWNIAKIDDKYYNLDATWDTSYYEVFHTYQYFLRSDQNFLDHVRDDKYLADEFTENMSDEDFDIENYHPEEPDRPVGDSNPWTDYAAEHFSGGDGTEESPYEIATAEELALLAKNVNADIGRTAHYILTEDIDLFGHSWEPIGLNTPLDGGFMIDMSFKGDFDGNNHIISNMSVNQMNAPHSYGFFGDMRGTVKNVTFRSSSINLTFEQEEKIGVNVGICAGLLNGRITNCKVDDSVVNVIEAQEMGGSIGGIVGYVLHSSMQDITGEIKMTIAIDGESNTNCVGGIAGEMRGDVYIRNASFAGTIDVDNHGAAQSEICLGGLIGLESAERFEIASCKAEGSITNKTQAGDTKRSYGGIGYIYCGQNRNGQIVDCHLNMPVLIEKEESIEYQYSFVDSAWCICLTISDCDYVDGTGSKVPVSQQPKHSYKRHIDKENEIAVYTCENCGDQYSESIDLDDYEGIIDKGVCGSINWILWDDYSLELFGTGGFQYDSYGYHVYDKYGNEYFLPMINRSWNSYLDEIITVKMNVQGCKNFSGLLSGMPNLIEADFSETDFSNALFLHSFAYNCPNLQKISFGEGAFRNAINMNQMFADCSNLEIIENADWSANEVTEARGMFAKASKLKHLDLQGFDTTNIKDMASMFYGCSNLTIDNLVLLNDTSVYTYLFGKCATEEGARINLSYGDACTESVVRKYIGTATNPENIVVTMQGEHTFYPVKVECSCSDYGYTKYICADCDHSYIKAGTYEQPLGHTWGEYTTCEGSCWMNDMIRTCSTCGMKDSIVKMEGYHQWEDGYTVDVEPTEDTDGSRSIHCKVCDAISESEAIPRTSHSMKVIRKIPATCTEDGAEAHLFCDTCNKRFSIDGKTTEVTEESLKLDAYGHDVRAVDEVKATCSKEGNIAHYLCGYCGKCFEGEDATMELTEQDIVLAKDPMQHASELKHTEGKLPNCIEEGVVENWYCEDCKLYFTDEAGTKAILEKDLSLAIDADNHKSVLVKTEAVEQTCIADGNVEYWTCPDCKKLYLDKEGKTETTAEAVVIQKDATKHKSELKHTEGKLPNCTEEGIAENWYCSDCKLYFTDEAGTKVISEKNLSLAIDAENHKSALAKTEAVEPNCITDGNMEYWTCPDCKKLYLDKNGKTETTAEAVVIQKDAAKHKYECTSNKNGTHTIACIYEESEGQEEACNYVKTENEDGSYVNTCTKCGYEEIHSWGMVEPVDAYAAGYTIDTIPEGMWYVGLPEAVEYNGASQTFDLHIYDGRLRLVEKKDYEVKYSSNKKAGTGKIEIKGKGNYSFLWKKNFAINKYDISTLIVEPVMVQENGKVIKSAVKVSAMLNGRLVTLKKDTDYTLSYPNTNSKVAGYDKNAFKAPGEHIIEIKGKGNFTGTTTAKEIIIARDEYTYIGTTSITVSSPKYNKDAAMSEQGIVPTVTVKKGKKSFAVFTSTAANREDALAEYEAWSQLAEENVSDFICFFTDNHCATSAAKATIFGIEARGYIGTVTKTFKISGSALKDAKYSKLKTLNYTGYELFQDFTVKSKDGKRTLEGIAAEQYSKLSETDKYNYDYIYEYRANINKGTASIVLTGVNGYTGTVTKKFTISAYDIKADQSKDEPRIKVFFADTEEQGTSIVHRKGGAKPEVKVLFFYDDAWQELTNGVDYSVSYGNNTTVASSTTKKAPYVKITGKGNFSGSLTMKFDITGTDLSTLSITAADRAASSSKGAFKSSVKIVDEDGKALVANKDYNKTLKYYYVNEDGTRGEEISSKAVVPADTLVWVEATGKNNYSGTLHTIYRIAKYNISSASVTVAKKQYTGAPIVPTKEDITSIKIKVGKKYMPIDDSQYEIVDVYANVNKGTGKMVIKGKNEFCGTKIVSFTIEAKKVP